MENSWQSKCGSLWQQLHPPPPDPPPSLVSSSLLEIYTQESMLLTSGTIQDHMLSNMHGFDNLGHVDLGASFLSLVSGTAPHIPCDEQRLLDPKPVSVANLVSSNRTASAFSGGSRVSILPGALWPSNVDCPNLTSGDAFFPLTSSNPNVNGSNSSANLNFQKSRDVACRNTYEKNKVDIVSSLIENNNATPVSADSCKLQKSAHITSLQKFRVESNGHHGCNTPSSSLRVFCLGTSGNLLLSDTGLLGVVCACHGLYMSISKFSEHSGYCDVNPGLAVRMDNGETLAHWWQTFFSKTGIRVLEGQRGWDWPEGISVAYGLTNHPMASMSSNPLLLNQVGLLTPSVSLEQQKYSGIYSKESQICRNTVDKYPSHERDRTSQECSNSIFEYFTNGSHRNPQHAAGQHINGLPKSFCSLTEKASQSTTNKLDSIYDSSIYLSSLPYIPDLKMSCNSPGVSSNIELRLGQKPEQSLTLETKVQPAFLSVLNGMHTEPSKEFFPDKILQKTSTELQGSRLTLQYADIASNPTERRGSTQLEHSRNVGKAYGAKADYQRDPSNVSLEMTNVNSLLLSCFKTSGTKSQVRNIYDNSSDSHVGEKLHLKSHTFESEKISPPWSSVAANMKKFGTNVSNVQINKNKGKEVECSPNALLGAAKSSTEFSKAFKEDQNSFNLFAGENSSKYSSAFHEKSLNSQSQQMSAMIAESNGRANLNYYSNNFPLSDFMHFNRDHVKPIQSSIVSKKKMPMSLSSKSPIFAQNATPTLSKEQSSGIKIGLQYENVEMPTLWNKLESSNRNNGTASVKSVQERETIKNPRAQSLLSISPSASKEQTNLLDSLRMQRLPEVGEKPMLPGTVRQMGHNNERFGTTTGISLYTDSSLPPPEHLLLRPRGTECISSHSKEHCSQGLPFAYVPEKCSSAAQENCLAGKGHLSGNNFCNLVKKDDRIGAASSLLRSKLNENCIFLKDTAESNEKTVNLAAANIKRAESHSFLWRDVPKKIMESCNSTRKEQQGCSYIQSLGSPAADAAKCLTGLARNVVSLKEQEILNISSGCSAPDATQSSIEANNNDSSTVDGGNIRCANNLSLNEGSGIDRSWSSDDARDNEYCAGFFGSTSSLNLTKREPSKVVPRKQPLSLIEEIRLQNASFRIKRSSTIQEEKDCLEKFELGPKKRRKTVKWMKLDVSAPLSFQSSVNDGSPKCTEEVGQNAHSSWEMQMPVGCDQGSRSNCADSIKQSVEQRNSVFSAVKGISQRKNLQKVYHQGEQQTTESHKSLVVDDTSEDSATFRKKRLRLDDASASCKQIQEICCNSAELASKLTSLSVHSNSLGNSNFYKWMARPTVSGTYGVICNGNPLKPPKIVPLRTIFKTAVSLSDKGNKNGDDGEKLKSASVKVKNTGGGHVKETALSTKVQKSQVKKGGTHNSQPIEPEYGDWSGDVKTASCSVTHGSDDLSYSLKKCNNHGITERQPWFQQKTKFKEGRKRSLHELLVKGNSSRVFNSIVSKSSSSCQGVSRYCGELMEKDVNGRARTNEMNNAMRCSEKHQPENSDMFCCVLGDSDRDEYNRLLQCSRSLIKQMNANKKGVPPLEGITPNSDSENLQPGEKSMTCARTEGYKGRKRDGFLHNHAQGTDGNGGCLVSQEQLNAWVYIHRQKPQMKGRPKLSSSNVETDCRKAYARYKQSKEWKHLVVYKSGIHALGLYTSRFISRGAMVVEYIGEIVGQRVADRREKEYHSGKKLQHKSACYFFRIDKEHIIDATRKGGIARFVNHSCKPNCVAKVISVRAEKKVVFFADRDIYPGEEITYDYHFNHEDEGQKIPCYCNSKDCRRYLN
ncbi:hypothetical protein ACS0TY_031571 [Phlomoides rotata]